MAPQDLHNKLHDEPFKPFIDNLRAAGIATVIASGNDGSTNQLSAPACVSSAVSVGATTKDDRVADYSNVAPFLSLFAPGDEIISLYPGESFTVASGTSMAAPHVAGTAALMLSLAPNASSATIESVLDRTTTEIDLPGWDYYSGWGMVDALNAARTIAPSAFGLTPQPPPVVRRRSTKS